MRMNNWIWAAVAVLAFAVGYATNQFCFLTHPADDNQSQVGFQGKTVYPMTVDFSLPDLHGNQIDSDSWRDQTILLNFWATWCAPCLKEMPLLNELNDRYAADDLKVVGISLDDEKLTREFLDRLNVDYTILLGDQHGTEVGGNLNVPLFGLPATIAISADRHQHQVYLGELNKKKVRQLLRNVDFGI